MVSPTPPDGLSPREVEVLSLIGDGLSNVEISERLFLTVNTVKTHIKAAYRKIGAERRSQAVIWAFTNGLVDLEEHARRNRRSAGRFSGTSWSEFYGVTDAAPCAEPWRDAVVDQAIGVLVAAHLIDPVAARERLEQIAAAEGRTPTECARQIIAALLSRTRAGGAGTRPLGT